MTSGGDHVALENYAVGNPEAQNNQWVFQMYGPPSKTMQTFHDQALARVQPARRRADDHDGRGEAQAVVRRALLLALALAAGCAARKHAKEDRMSGAPEVPDVIDRAGIVEHAGERVRVVGRYTQLDVRVNPTGAPEFRGHVTLILDDRTAVLLEAEWREQAIRPAEEIARLAEKRVAATGMILPRAPRHPEGAASPALPCLVEIESVTAR